MPPALLVRVHGARGSVPAPGPRTVRHGGNTSCVEVCAADGTRLVLDAGTGIRALGDRLVAEARAAGRGVDVTLCITHAHWDHVQGLPFFAPLYERDARVRILAAEPLAAGIARALRDQMRAPVFPVSWDALSATIELGALPADGVAVDIGGLAVRPVPARHPGGATGFRVAPRGGAADDARAAVVYLPDNEIAEAGGDAAWRRDLLAPLRGAALLLHDATYLPDEMPRRGGWGHSAWDETVRLAAEAGVARLALFHHHAERSDEALDDIVDAARALAAGTGTAVLAASEELVLHLG